MSKSLTQKVIVKAFMDMLPLNLAVIPWGILCGSLAIQRDFTIFEALLMPILVFAGSVQLVATELIGGNASLTAILFTTFIISSRHFLYGLTLRNKLKNLPNTWRFSLGFLLTDELFALSQSKNAFKGKVRLVYALVAGGSFYIFWLLWNIIGIFAGSYLPNLTDLGLDFAIAVTFIALVIPTVTNIPVLITVVVAGVSSVTFKLLTWDLDLVCAAILSMYAGYFTLNFKNKAALKNKNFKNEGLN